MNVSTLNLAAASLSSVLLGLVFGTLALAIGASTGKKGTALGVAAGVALVTFLIHTLAPMVDWMEPAHILSPFYYNAENQPLVTGLHWGHAAVLAVSSVALAAIGLVAFNRRDIRS